MEQVITVRNLNKEFQVKRKGRGFKESFKSLFNPRFEKVKAIDNISFEVGQGEILAFIGPNGAGKSTTIKVLTGILYPTGGKVSVLGLTPWEQRQTLAFKIGSVFGQRPQLWYHLPAGDTFELFSKIYELERSEYKKRVEFLIEAFEVEDFLDIPVRKLSLGQRMRCEIVASLLHNPEILFLDEPTIGLDVVGKQTIRDVLLALNKENKTTIFLTSHDVTDIEAICERTIIINHGQIIFDGDTNKLKKKYLANKVLKFEVEESLEGLSLPYGEILEKTKYSVTIEIDSERRSVNELLNLFLKRYKVIDVSITDTPLEEIISKIYLEEKK